jgi:hypothetical protein
MYNAQKKNARGVHGQKHLTDNANISSASKYTTNQLCALAFAGAAAFFALLELVIFPLMYQVAAHIHGWC